MKYYNIDENGLHMIFQVNSKNRIKLIHFSVLPYDETLMPHDAEGEKGVSTERFRPVEFMISGQDRAGERHGNKYIGTCPGDRLVFRDFSDYRNSFGRKLEITTEDNICHVNVTIHYQFYDNIKIIRAWSEVKNVGDTPQGIEYISSFALTGITKEGKLPEDRKMLIHIPHSGWQRELQWQKYSFAQLGFENCQPHNQARSSKTISASNVGNWSSKEYLPEGVLENTETGTSLFWEIENNGSWHWEVSDEYGNYYIQLSGPTETESHWWKNLLPGETFVTVPAAIGSVSGSFDECMDELTKYRRKIRRKNKDNENLPVIFNDYMNCLFGNPTSEKEFPLIDAAAKAGCEYYVIDAGWYADGHWWDSVGEWQPSSMRFPNGLSEVTDYIKKKGMIPGLWLEIEVMGIHCPSAGAIPDNWFFIRHGKKVHDRSRWQLDFRNPEVRNFADSVVDRLIKDFGIGYIKMDYNIEPGIGTELDADSFGDGLLGHERAYISWLDSLFVRYPDLVIENCSSGGMRMDYAMLSRCSIQSTSDQENFLLNATIAANSPSGLAPEQAAVWSYPLTGSNPEESVFNMVNALLLRIHQSGHLANISAEDFELVKKAIKYYKSIRQDIKTAVPFWPLGPSHFSDEWISLGLKTEGKTYVAVWKRNASSSSITLNIQHLKGRNISVSVSYPDTAQTVLSWDADKGSLTVGLTAPVSARIIELISLDH
jgi:alpha-galactosidase